jgi:hypothetical protein
VTWLTPQTCPSWFAKETLAALPETLVLREARYQIGPSGFRIRQVPLVTMLLDPERYPVTDLAELYRQRWPFESSLAHLKTTMQMEVLRCKTVPGVLKELTVFALVDNLVRLVMRPSATLQHTAVERISFVEALRWLERVRYGHAVSGGDREPCAPPSGGAAGQEAATQKFPLHDHTPAGAASAVIPARVQEPTSCHSALGPFW